MIRAFRIMEGNRVVESHDNARDAERAFWILVAHETKNGRLETAIALTLQGCHARKWEACDLPRWATDVLSGNA
jgi:hypothetical protein